jgi:hypothetical protein
MLQILLTALFLSGLGLACTGLADKTPTKEPAFQPQTEVAEAADTNLALTVYNQGTALVRDRRQLDLDEGLNVISFRDVAASIDPTSVLFESLTDPSGTTVLEQNYEYDLVGLASLLEKYLDETILVVTEDGSEYQGKLLSGREDIILQNKAGEVTVVKLDNVQEFSFPELPEGLIVKPTLVWRLLVDQSGSQDIEVTYLTGGISWKADYVLLLGDQDKSIDLDGWVTLNNHSGTTFKDALLKLVAGDIQRLPTARMAAGEMMMEFEAPAPTPQIEQREFFEYHLYEVPRPVTVQDQETKQIEFVTTKGVPAEKFFVYDGLQCRVGYWYCSFYGSPRIDPGYGISSNPKVMVMVEFDTEDVDADLPKGNVRVYQEDVDGAALLIGEDSIDHTPQGESVRLYVGDAFDIVGERVQTDFRRPTEKSLQESFQITLRNHKDEDIEVRVVEHLSRWSEWRILEKTADYTKLDSSTIEFRIQVPADGERTLSYTVLYEWK